MHLPDAVGTGRVRERLSWRTISGTKPGEFGPGVEAKRGPAREREQFADADEGDILPEQPFPLVPVRASHSIRVGKLLPIRRRRSLLPAILIPRVPKRAIFAVGMCAGLAAPSIGRQLLGQVLGALFGSGPVARGGLTTVEAVSVEIIRIGCTSATRGAAGETLARLLDRVAR